MEVQDRTDKEDGGLNRSSKLGFHRWFRRKKQALGAITSSPNAASWSWIVQRPSRAGYMDSIDEAVDEPMSRRELTVGPMGLSQTYSFDTLFLPACRLVTL